MAIRDLGIEQASPRRVFTKPRLVVIGWRFGIRVRIENFKRVARESASTRGVSGSGSRQDSNPETILAAADDAQRAAQVAASSKWYLPGDERGEWLGEKGNSKFRLKKPIDANGKLVKELSFVRRTSSG